MANIKLVYEATQSLTVTGFNSLASAGIATSNEIDNTVNLYLDYLVEIVVADIVEAGNKQIVILAASSIDGTNYSFINANNLQIMSTVGIAPLNDVGPWRSRSFSVAQAFGGVVPPKFKLVMFNDAGIVLAASGNSAQYRGVHASSV